MVCPCGGVCGQLKLNYSTRTDDYFLTNVQEIDKVCEDKKQLFFTKVKWDASVVKCIETYPSANIIPQKNENDLRCRLCHDNWSTLMFNFTGVPYDSQTLEQRDVSDIKQTKYAACDACKDRVLLFSRLHHSKYNFFTKCQEKVSICLVSFHDSDISLTSDSAGGGDQDERRDKRISSDSGTVSAGWRLDRFG